MVAHHTTLGKSTYRSVFRYNRKMVPKWCWVILTLSFKKRIAFLTLSHSGFIRRSFRLKDLHHKDKTIMIWCMFTPIENNDKLLKAATNIRQPTSPNYDETKIFIVLDQTLTKLDRTTGWHGTREKTKSLTRNLALTTMHNPGKEDRPPRLGTRPTTDKTSITKYPVA